MVAVCVTSNPNPDFDVCLESLMSQDYSNLSILVVDAGSDTPVAERVAALAPDAFIHRIQNNPGFSAAANQALSLVSDAPFLLFCHDDVALDAHCVSALVEELFRSNAGIVTPKVVEWEDQRRLVQVGMGSDRFGVQVDLVEPREFDQEQYDGVRDVFVAPSGVQMMRADLFRTLHGFDGALGGVNEDLDLCWRAHAVGARVVVVPSTFIRHHNNHGPDEPKSAAQRSRVLARNRLRTVLVTSSRINLIRTLPAMLLLMLLEATYLTLAGRRGQAKALVGSVSWNLSRLGEIRERRALLREVRKVPDAEIRALQVGGSARLNGFFRGQFGAGQDRLAGFVGSVKANLSGAEATSARAALAAAGFLLLVGLFGSRNLVSDGIVPVGQIPVLPSGGALLGEWWSGWRSVGIGGAGASPLVFFVLGIVRSFFFVGSGVLDTLLVIGPLVIGAVGVWRLLSRFGSPRASGLAAIAYAANPLPVAAMGEARWDALVVWGATPFLVISALRLQGAVPFTSRVDGLPDRTLPIRLLRYGLLVAAAATFVPAVIVVGVIVPAALIVASILIARPRGTFALLLGTAAAVLVPVGLHAPWSGGVLRRFSWDWFIGPDSSASGFDSLADLMRFTTGSGDAGVLVIGLLVAAGLGMVTARASRFDAVARGWTLAAAAWFLVWAARRGWIPFDLPAAEVLLPLAATGLALAVGATVRSIEVDLAARGRTWRLVTTSVLALSLLLVSFVVVRSSFDGRWDLPSQSYSDFTALLSAQDTGSTRVLWLGDPSIMPLDIQRSNGDIPFAITNGGSPNIINRYAPGNYGINDQIGDRLDLAVQGQSSNLGSLLAPYGIDLVIVVPRLAPAPYAGRSFEPGGGIAPVLDQQLDLRRIPGTPNLVVYRNDESRGPAVSLMDVDAVLGVSPAEQLDTDLTVGERAALAIEGSGHWRQNGDSVIVGPEVMLAVPASGWSANNDSTEIRTNEADTLILQSVGEEPLDVGFVTSSISRIVLLGQLLLIAGGVVLAQSRREDPT